MNESKTLHTATSSSEEHSLLIGKRTLRERKRHRRTPDVAEAEILDAAERLLRRVPFSKLTIERLMATTELSRPSFYQYFADLYELLAKLAERHVKVVSQITRRYGDYIFGISETDLLSEEAAAVRQANFVELCKEHRRHRHFHRLLIQSSALDLRGRRIYRNYIRAMGQSGAALIRQLQSRGIGRSLDPEETGLALHLMMEFYMLEKVVEEPGSNFEKVAETLKTIWEKVIYGELPARRSAATTPQGKGAFGLTTKGR